MSDIEYEIQNEEIQKLLKNLADKLAADMPEGFGFTLLIFSYGDDRSLFYISTAQRADMIRTMEEFVRKKKKR